MENNIRQIAIQLLDSKLSHTTISMDNLKSQFENNYAPPIRFKDELWMMEREVFRSSFNFPQIKSYDVKTRINDKIYYVTIASNEVVFKKIGTDRDLIADGLYRELTAYARLDSCIDDFIVGFNCIGIFMKKCVNLEDFMVTLDYNSHTTIVQQITDNLIAGLKHIHIVGIIHADIKPGNLLVDYDANNNLIMRFCDFEDSILIDEIIMGDSKLGTLGYIAPEVYCNLMPFSRQSDIWSLGCVIMWLWINYDLFEEQPEFIDNEYIESQLQLLSDDTSVVKNMLCESEKRML